MSDDYDNLSSKYISEVSKLSDIDPLVVDKIVSTQIAIMLRDLGIKKRAFTVYGEVRLIDGKIVLVSRPLKEYLDRNYMIKKLQEGTEI